MPNPIYIPIHLYTFKRKLTIIMFICESPSLNEAFVSCFFFLLFAGCCFVTFYTRKAALKAQDALHNIKTLVGVCKEYVVVFLYFDYIYIIRPICYDICSPFELQ